MRRLTHIVSLICAILILTQTLYGLPYDTIPSNKTIYTEQAPNNKTTDNRTIDNRTEGSKEDLSQYTYNILWGAQTLQGLDSRVELYVYVPHYWQIDYGKTHIEVSVSNLLKDKPATLTFSLNDEPFYSIDVSYKGEASQSIQVDLPLHLLKEGFNRIQILGMAKIYEQEGCINQSSSANWVKIDKQSFIEIGYRPKTYDYELYQYPYPFISTMKENGEGTAILITDYKSTASLQTAMTIMAHLGGQTKEENQIAIGRWEERKNLAPDHTIVISTKEQLPPQLMEYIQGWDLTEGVLIQVVPDENNQPMLLIVSEDEESLKEAGDFLADDTRVGHVEGYSTFVKKGSADTIKENTKENHLIANRYTLEEMTGGGLSFIGPGHQIKHVFVPVTQDFILGKDTKMMLQFRYSKNIDFNKSMLTVYWGDIPIVSKKLSEELADGDELSFLVPNDVVGAVGNRVSFAFDLEIGQEACIGSSEDMPWAYITQDSWMNLESNISRKLNFDSRPSPLQREGKLNQVLIVVQDEPFSEELTLLGRLLSLYTVGLKPYGTLEVVHDEQFDDFWYDYHVIAVGMPSDHGLIKSLNAHLYFQYDETFNNFQDNKMLILDEFYSQQIGTFQFLESPFNPEYGMIILTAPLMETLQQMSDFISLKENANQLKGDCVILNTRGETASFQFKKVTKEEQKPKLIEAAMENKTMVFFLIISTGTIGILLLGVVLILMRNRKDG